MSHNEAAVLAEVTTYETSEEIISNECARMIASWWHSPSVYDEAITRLSHRGEVTEEILGNIDRIMPDDDETDEEEIVNRRTLTALRAYCVAKLNGTI